MSASDAPQDPQSVRNELHGRSAAQRNQIDMQYEHFDCEIDRGVATVNLIGAGATGISAFSDEMLDLMLRLQEDNEARAILLVDSEASFDIGIDIARISSERSRGEGMETLYPELEAARKIVTLIHEIGKPIVFAAGGDVRDGGFGLFMASDVRLAASSASLTPPNMASGMLPDWGLSHTLPQIVGLSRALEIIWSGRTVSAEEAGRIGLVDRVIPVESWEIELAAFSDRLASLPQPAVRLSKLANQQSRHFDMTAMLSLEYEVQEQCWSAAETTEGMSALVEGRKPLFTPGVVEEDLDA